MTRTMQAYGPFAATERLLMALVKAGADRQVMHERIREHSLAAWAAGQRRPAQPADRCAVRRRGHHELCSIR